MTEHPKFVFKTILYILIVLFLYSLFKNISYPLLWFDESQTAIMGKQVIKYGYPKITDEKYIERSDYQVQIGNVVIQ